MAKKINLKAYTFPAKTLDYRSGDILKKVRQNQELARVKQSFGLVTSGVLEATQIEGGYGWAISNYIEFAYDYVLRPIFTWGLDGTAGIEYTNGGNNYSEELPPDLLAFGTLDEETNTYSWDSSDYQPAIFVPRVIHWYIEDYIFKGCYLMVCQVNSESTETDKILRIHFRFEGEGFSKS